MDGAFPVSDPRTGALVDRWVLPAVRELAAYHVPDASGLVKLDAMENPYTWPDDLRERWLAALRDVEINRYPDPGARHLQARLRSVMGVPDGMALLLGNGSDELIQVLVHALGGPGATVIAPEPGFVMYRLIALTAGRRYAGVDLRQQDFSLDVDAMLERMEREQPAVVFLAYPNNPTGNLFDEGDVLRIVDAAPGLVVVDEAYEPFAGATFMSRLGKYPNLLVMRTVSKLGLAGLRLGLLAGPPAWIHELDKLRLPYNINVLTQASASFALEHYPVLEEQTARIRAERETLHDALVGLPGVHPWPSRANFILFRVAPGRAGAVHSGLREAGVLIKNLDGAAPALSDCLRVTVGRPEENAAFLDALTPLVHSA